MPRPKAPALAPRNRYRELLIIERAHARTWPRHDGRLLADLERGLPVVVWGHLAGVASPVARLHPDGTAAPLPEGDPDAVALHNRPSHP